MWCQCKCYYKISYIEEIALERETPASHLRQGRQLTCSITTTNYASAKEIYMKILLIITMVLTVSTAAFSEEQKANRADIRDVKLDAEFAVARKYIQASEPVFKKNSATVKVQIMDKTCVVTVDRYEPKSDLEPPIRWKVKDVKCEK